MEHISIQKLEDLLLVNVPAELTDSQVLQVRRLALQALKQHHSRWVLLDFSRVEVCDSFFGRFIHSMTETVRMLGASVVVSSLQDAVIETLVEMGFTFPGVHAVLDLDDALALSREVSQSEEKDWDSDVAALIQTTGACTEGSQPPLLRSGCAREKLSARDAAASVHNPETLPLRGWNR